MAPKVPAYFSPWPLSSEPFPWCPHWLFIHFSCLRTETQGGSWEEGMRKCRQKRGSEWGRNDLWVMEVGLTEQSNERVGWYQEHWLGYGLLKEEGCLFLIVRNRRTGKRQILGWKGRKWRVHITCPAVSAEQERKLLLVEEWRGKGRRWLAACGVWESFEYAVRNALRSHWGELEPTEHLWGAKV